MLVRDYADSDAEDWLRCRVLAFLHTQYYDDVLPDRPSYDLPSVRLVAVDGGGLVGLMDVTVAGALATIDTVGVHPDHGRRGIETALLRQAMGRLPGLGADTLDAWTREDAAANAWYLASGFTERFRYVHGHTAGAANRWRRGRAWAVHSDGGSPARGHRA